MYKNHKEIYAMLFKKLFSLEGLTIACRNTLLVSCQDREELCLLWSLSSRAVIRLCFSDSVNKCKQNYICIIIYLMREHFKSLMHNKTRKNLILACCSDRQLPVRTQSNQSYSARVVNLDFFCAYQANALKVVEIPVLENIHIKSVEFNINSWEIN